MVKVFNLALLRKFSKISRSLTIVRFVQTQKEYDLTVLGATGFTGKYVVNEIVKQLGGNLKKNLKWAIAGRNKSGLEEIVKSIQDPNVKPAILVADINRPQSLNSVTSPTKILLNCVGPYSIYGDPVIKSCLEFGTHMQDVSGEPLYLEKSQLKYHQEALDKKLYLIGSCGTDSIPADIGIAHISKDNRIKFAESFLKVEFRGKTKFGFATWQSLVNGFAHYEELKKVKKELFANEPRSGQIPRATLRRMSNQYVVPFAGSDRSVIRRTQLFNKRHLDLKPIPVETYFILPKLSQLIGLSFSKLFILLLSRSQYGVQLLNRHSNIFSFGYFDKRFTPDPAVLDTARFEIRIVGKSESGEDIKLKINGPDPGYQSAAICLVTSASVLLEQSDKIPLPGGCLTPGFAFQDTDIVKRLDESGIQFVLE